MYSNPRHLRDFEIKVRVTEKTYRLVEAMADYVGTQRAVLARELLEEGLAGLASQYSLEKRSA